MTSENLVDELLDSAKVLVVTGLGGVGKTTLSAAIALRAATKFEKRALVVTVDPARRLAEALGIEGTSDEPILVPVGGAGRLWALTVDMEASWNRLVHECAPNEEVEQALLSNGLFQSLTTRFVRSHDYIALDHLASRSDYDLVIIDTPPSVHVLDVLDAPDQMMELFESRLLKWLTASNQSVITTQMARPFLAIASRALGSKFLSEVSDFFFLFSQLRPSFVRRLELITRRLAAPTTRFVTVATAETAASSEVAALSAAIAERGYHPALAIRNKAWPELAQTDWTGLENVGDESLRSALSLLQQEAETGQTLSGRTPVVDVAYRPAGFNSVADLGTLFD